jgi:manganese/zinc/iron transport system permease protein
MNSNKQAKETFIPDFDVIDTFITPWSTRADILWNGQIITMGFLVSLACGLVGSFIVVRKLALMGDAISHGILPGLALAFMIMESRALMPMFFGACAAGLLCSLCIEWLQKKSILKPDAALGLTFTTFFAFGVLLISLYGGNAHIDPECLLYGEIGLVPLAENLSIAGIGLGSRPLTSMLVVTILVIVSITVFYRQLLVTSFDFTLAKTLGLPVSLIHYGLMLILALTIVSAFEAVGVILVISMLIFPSVTASFFFSRMPAILFSTLPLSVVYSTGGFFLARWLDCSIAGAMVLVAGFFFSLSWAFGPNEGLLWQILKHKKLPNKKEKEREDTKKASSFPEAF